MLQRGERVIFLSFGMTMPRQAQLADNNELLEEVMQALSETQSQGQRAAALTNHGAVTAVAASQSVQPGQPRVHSEAVAQGLAALRLQLEGPQERPCLMSHVLQASPSLPESQGKRSSTITAVSQVAALHY